MRRETQQTNGWSHYAKAAAVFTLTTATYLLARTTGWLPGWFDWEKFAENGEALSTLCTDVTAAPLSSVAEIVVAEPITVSGLSETMLDRRAGLIRRNQRRLLQQRQSSVSVVHSIPDQIIEIDQPYQLPLNTVFSGNYTLLDAVATGKTALPDWLALQFQLRGAYSTGATGFANDVVLTGSTVLVAAQYGGLQIWDIRDPEQAQLLSIYPGYPVESVAINGGIAYLACGSNGLHIVDVGLLFQPQLLAIVPAGAGSAYQAAVMDEVVLVMNDVNIQIVNVSNSTHPQVLKNYPVVSGHARGVALNRRTAFIADYEAGLLILDLSQPVMPRQLSKTALPNGAAAQSILLRGQTLFVGSWGDGLFVYDVSNASHPQLLGSDPAGLGYVQGMAVAGQVLMVGDGSDGFRIYDTSDLAQLRLLSNYPAGAGVASAVAINNSLAILADGNSGFLIIDVSQAQLTGVPLLPLLGQTEAITVSARDLMNMTTLASTSFTLVLDRFPQLTQSRLATQSVFPSQSLSLPLSSAALFSNPSHSFLRLAITAASARAAPSWLTLTATPVMLSNIFSGSRVEDAVINGTIAFVACGYDGLQIVDITDPASPKILSIYPFPAALGYVGSVTLSGDVVLAGDWENGLQIINVTDPRRLQIESVYPSGGSHAYRVAVVNRTAFVADYSVGVQIVDISDLSRPVSLANYSATQYPEDVVVSNGTLFIASWDGGLQIVNVLQPSQPQWLFTYPSSAGGAGYGVFVAGRAVFFADAVSLEIVDVSVLTQPQRLCSYSESAGLTQAVTVKGRTAFVSNQGAGLQILAIDNITAPYVMGSYAAGSGQIRRVTVNGNLALVADFNQGLQMVDLSRWRLTLSPNVTDIGNYLLRLTATDETGGSSVIDFTVRVEGPPQLNGSIPLQRAWVGQPFNYFVPPDLFVDSNDDVISYSADLAGGKNLPGWLQFNPLTVSFGGVPQSSDAGNVMIILSATDHICPQVPTVNFTISVGFLPVLSHKILNQLVPIGLPYKFSVPKNSFYDPDGLALSYLAQGVNNQPLPSWLRFNATLLMFSGIADTSSVTVYTLQLIANNSAGGQVIATFTLRTDHFPVLNKTLLLPMAVVNQPWVWTLPSDAFTDADGDALTYAATQDDGGALPSWLSFNPITRVFTGAPVLMGIQGVKLTAQDIYGGSNSTYLNMTIVQSATSSSGSSTITSPGARVGKLYVFQVPSSNFNSSEIFNYSTSLTDGASLPSWLKFFAGNLSFIGLPDISNVGSYDVTLTVTDIQGVQYNVSFMLTVNPNYPPQVCLPISNQVAQVGEPFVFYASFKTFLDPNGDNLTYTVNALSSWLSFDPSQLKFSGTPSRSDTDPLSARRVNVELTAHDDQSQTSTLFTISVKGTSSLMLFLQVGIPLLSAIGSLLEAYRNRALVLNRCCKKRIVKSEAVAITGEEFRYDFKTQPKQVGKIQVKLPKPEETKSTASCCARLFRPCKEIWEESPKHLPAAYPLPTWLAYKADRNRLFSKKRVPPVKYPQFTVQVFNSAGVIREELAVTVQGARV
jgi:hypothetical protein